MAQATNAKLTGTPHLRGLQAGSARPWPPVVSLPEPERTRPGCPACEYGDCAQHDYLGVAA